MYGGVRGQSVSDMLARVLGELDPHQAARMLQAVEGAAVERLVLRI